MERMTMDASQAGGTWRRAIATAWLLCAPTLASAQSGLEQGIRLFDGRRYDSARSQITAFAEVNPGSAAAAFYLGRIALVERDLGAATRWLERATRLDGNGAAYHYWLGQAYARQALTSSRFRQFFIAKKVKQEFLRAVELDPQNPEFRVGLFQFYVMAPGVVGGGLDKARVEADELYKRDRLRGLLARGFLEEKQNRTEAAEALYKEAVASFPDDPDAYNALGLFYTRVKRYDDAFSVFERILERKPEALQPYYYLGRVGALSGLRLDRSEEVLKHYIAHLPGEDDPPLSHAHTRLGTIYERKGDAAAARQEYEMALKLEPDYAEARGALGRIR
ncbi:MAG: tetratricopeptide repeat protein [Gemmatimonadota bacterium]|nr:tetratricopeptide repeat protein [Gemmatimonadota bacterium]